MQRLDRALRRLVVRSGKRGRNNALDPASQVKGRYPFWNNVSLLLLYERLPAAIRADFDMKTMQAHVKAVRRPYQH